MPPVPHQIIFSDQVRLSTSGEQPIEPESLSSTKSAIGRVSIFSYSYFNLLTSPRMSDVGTVNAMPITSLTEIL